MTHDGEWVRFKREQLCKHCRKEYFAYGQVRNGVIVARCAECDKNLDGNDYARYGHHFGLERGEGIRRSTRYDRKKKSDRFILEILDGDCVHHALELETGVPRRVHVPATWLSQPPVKQISMFASNLSEVPITPIEALKNGEHDDHLVPHSIYERISPQLSDHQRMLCESIWKVPSCADHNQVRRGKIENLDYLVRAFGLNLTARRLEINDEFFELQAFIDVIKTAHHAIAYENALRKLAAG